MSPKNNLKDYQTLPSFRISSFRILFWMSDDRVAVHAPSYEMPSFGIIAAIIFNAFGNNHVICILRYSWYKDLLHGAICVPLVKFQLSQSRAPNHSHKLYLIVQHQPRDSLGLLPTKVHYFMIYSISSKIDILLCL